jgi:uncharacterized protein Smg (DUF494 family)
MRDARDEALLRLLRLIADHLEGFLDGDDLSFETLGEALEEGGYGPEEIQTAIAVLRGFGTDADGDGSLAIEGAPGKRATRIWSAEERETLSPEAWGYLLELRHRGALDHEQFERVLDVLTGSPDRPVGVDLAREVAARVALDVDDREEGGGIGHGEIDLAH